MKQKQRKQRQRKQRQRKHRRKKQRWRRRRKKKSTELIHLSKKADLMCEMLINSTRKDKQTQTSEDGRNYLSWGPVESSVDRSEILERSESDTFESDQRPSPAILARDRSTTSNPPSESPLQLRDQSASNQSNESHPSGPSAVDSEKKPASITENEENSVQSLSEVETRLQDVRIRASKACTRSLVLTNRVYFLVQRIKLEQIRSYGL